MNEITMYTFIILAGFIAGIINTMAGGGSLLTLPFLIIAGLDASIANGTNRIGIFIQCIFAIFGFKSKNIKPSKFSVYLGIVACIGSLIGAQIAVTIKGELFNKILAILMVFIVLFMVLKPKFNPSKTLIRISGVHFWVTLSCFFLIGIYGGFIQAGVGIFILLALTGINHFSLVEANAIKAVVVLIYTVSALLIFIFNQQINFLYGILLASGNALGGWIASRWAVQKGEKPIKIILILMVIVMAIKLWLDNQ